LDLPAASAPSAVRQAQFVSGKWLRAFWALIISAACWALALKLSLSVTAAGTPARARSMLIRSSPASR
jgi:hypothetical protein